MRYLGQRYSAFVHNATALSLSEYAIVDLHVGVETERWSLKLFARNLFDERAYTTIITPSQAAVLQPRVVGISVDVRNFLE